MFAYAVQCWLLICTLKHARESSERESRAYVAILHKKIEGEEPIPANTFRVRIKNCGQTPAYDLEGFFGWGVEEGPKRPWPKSKPFMLTTGNNPSKGTLGSGFEAQLDTPYEAYPPLIQAISHADRGDVTLYYFGTITYKDIFKKRVYKTDFCFRHVPGKPPSEGAVYSDHNDST